MTDAEMRGCWLRLFALPRSVEVIAHGTQTVAALPTSRLSGLDP